MLWTATSGFKPALPAHCEPSNDFLLRFSTTFHTCVPTPLAFVSNTLGILSIVAWLFAQLPQIYKNWSVSSTSGLSIFFLVEWCLGDIGNLLGALFTHQASWQVAIGSYYVFVDVCLVSQWLWYEKFRHGRTIRRVRQKDGNGPDDWPSGDGMHEVVIEGVAPMARGEDSGEGADSTKPGGAPKQGTRPRIIFRTPTFEQSAKKDDEKPTSSQSGTPNSTTIYRVGPSSPMPSPSPRTVLLIVCLAAIAQGSPLARPVLPLAVAAESHPTSTERVGTVLAWISTVLYLGSRLPQLYKNWQRKSTAGLSPHLFAAAFCGNLFYSSALATNPSGWNDFGPFGGGGWAGASGSERVEWVTAALPFFLGAAGVLGLDASVGVQFLIYGEGASKVVVVEEGRGRRWHWRKVSGWMRGWIPSISGGQGEEREALIERTDQHGEGYGAL